MSQFWDERYGTEKYFYGKEPNGFFKSCIDKNSPGHVLLPGDGEGRNSVYAARCGWDVHAFDPSRMGRKKALKLADEFGVEVHFEVSDLDSYQLEEESFDMIALIYVHLFPDERLRHHKRLLSALKPGGLLVMEVFSKKQFGNTSGGPKDLQLLYDIKELKDDFQSLEVVQAEEVSIFHDESFAHRGDAEIIRFIGKKK